VRKGAAFSEGGEETSQPREKKDEVRKIERNLSTREKGEDLLHAATSELILSKVKKGEGN